MWKEPLNAVIGDAGFVARFGRRPRRHDTEEERIRAHLLHVAELLRHSDGHPRRSECAELLEAYAERGRFPRHGGVPSRRAPIFVDGRGTPCAVAHLMRETGARGLCEAVDARHHHGYVPEMALPGAPLAPQLKAWASSVGLSAAELAAIQPAYTARDLRCLKAVFLLGLAGALASFAAAASGLAMLWQARRQGLPVSPSEWALAALGALQCLLLPLAFLEHCPGAGGGHQSRWPEHVQRAVWGVVEASRYVNVAYLVVAAVSLPLGLVLLAVISLWDAPASQARDLQALCKVAWTVLAAIGVLYALATAFVLLCDKSEGVLKEQRLKAEDTESSEESDGVRACC